MSFKHIDTAEVVWHRGQVNQDDRQKLLNQRPVTLWLTGLSASGKSTLAFALERRLVDIGYKCYVLDGDNIRHGLNKDLGFSHQDRTENIRRIAEVARLMNEAGLIVITAFISPYHEDRELARQIIGTKKFTEIYVNTPIAACEERDPKGMYKRARAGELLGFTGINSPYEAPTAPKIVIDTSSLSVSESVEMLLTQLMNSIVVAENNQQKTLAVFP
ncbi:MAG: adenylyl-sulfate kinase [Methylophilaceae bacterium]